MVGIDPIALYFAFYLNRVAANPLRNVLIGVADRTHLIIIKIGGFRSKVVDGLNFFTATEPAQTTNDYEDSEHMPRI